MKTLLVGSDAARSATNSSADVAVVRVNGPE